MSFSGKSVLVTGAGGSIGSRLCEQAIEEGAKRLTMISLTESGLYNINKHLGRLTRGTQLVPILGSVADECLVQSALHDVDIVVHAAAHKHVPMCEQNPIEAIRNNVFGSETLIWAAMREEVKQFCLISSDKAVKPASVMGATKRAAELIVARAGKTVEDSLSLKRSRNTSFFTVRFGNVLDSAGSVLPLWREQIRMGGPITLTDRRCERYFMSISDAVGLISNVIGMKPKGGTFVLDMGRPVNLADLAQETMLMMNQFVPIQEIGLRPGEKLTEELHHGGELVKTSVDGVLKVEGPELGIDIEMLNALEIACDECDEQGALDLLWELVRC